jgi:hypothetical protein
VGSSGRRTVGASVTSIGNRSTKGIAGVPKGAAERQQRLRSRPPADTAPPALQAKQSAVAMR